MSLRDIMSTNMVTVEMDDSLAVVREIFSNVRFHHLLVVEKGKLVGVVSDRDLLKTVSPHVGTPAETVRDAATLNRRVHQIMSRDLVTLPPGAGIHNAVRTFNTHGVSCIPVVDADGVPVGIVSWRDILKVLDRR